jgi:hypothetical protein
VARAGRACRGARCGRRLGELGGVFVAWAGGFVLVWVFNQPRFLDVQLAGYELREVLGVQPVSVAVWVGFLTLFGVPVLYSLAARRRLEGGDGEPAAA